MRVTMKGGSPVLNHGKPRRLWVECLLTDQSELEPIA